jgi:Asp-tRNA(Asn)/Glu-tRNA(Gln) amidotransferase C subunit
MAWMENRSADTDALLSRVDHCKLAPGALDALRAELEQLLEYAARLQALMLDGVEPALGPQRWT